MTLLVANFLGRERERANKSRRALQQRPTLANDLLRPAYVLAR